MRYKVHILKVLDKNQVVTDLVLCISIFDGCLVLCNLIHLPKDTLYIDNTKSSHVHKSVVLQYDNKWCWLSRSLQAFWQLEAARHTVWSRLKLPQTLSRFVFASAMVKVCYLQSGLYLVQSGWVQSTDPRLQQLHSVLEDRARALSHRANSDWWSGQGYCTFWHCGSCKTKNVLWTKLDWLSSVGTIKNILFFYLLNWTKVVDRRDSPWDCLPAPQHSEVPVCLIQNPQQSPALQGASPTLPSTQTQTLERLRREWMKTG